MNKKEIEELQKEYQEKSQEFVIYEDIMKLLNKIDTIVYVSFFVVLFEYSIWRTVYSLTAVAIFFMYKTDVAKKHYESKVSYLKGCMIEIEEKFDKDKADEKEKSR